MKILNALAIAIAISFASCNNTEMKNKVEATDPPAKTDTTGKTPASTGTSYVVQTDSSIINWKGKNKFTTKAHVGTLKISDGTVQAVDNQLTGGKFTADMNTIYSAGDQYTEGEKKVGYLVNHLKSDEFFDVQKFPTSTFEITAVKAAPGPDGTTHSVTGNLTIKGIVKQITFPATIAFAGDKVTATAVFTINRLDWDVSYGANESVKDKIISNDVELTLKVVAAKPQA